MLLTQHHNGTRGIICNFVFLVSLPLSLQTLYLRIFNIIYSSVNCLKKLDADSDTFITLFTKRLLFLDVLQLLYKFKKITNTFARLAKNSELNAWPLISE